MITDEELAEKLLNPHFLGRSIDQRRYIVHAAKRLLMFVALETVLDDFLNSESRRFLSAQTAAKYAALCKIYNIRNPFQENPDVKFVPIKLKEETPSE